MEKVMSAHNYTEGDVLAEGLDDFEGPEELDSAFDDLDSDGFLGSLPSEEETKVRERRKKLEDDGWDR